MCALYQICRLQPRPVRIKLDGVDLGPISPTLFYSFNMKYSGGGMPLGPLAVANDGLLDVSILADVYKLWFLFMFQYVHKGGTHAY